MRTRPRAVLAVVVVALAVTVTIGTLLVATRNNDDPVWAVRLRMPVASGELLGSEAKLPQKQQR